ncbi:MAG: hypothetical protein GY711_14620 [bacterium]|nr:hypothetical protein [bacterium]
MLERLPVVFFAAFVLRLGLLAALQDPCSIAGRESAWNWGYEQAAIAEALVRGDGFADVFAKGSGPTGWCAPAFASILAAVFRVCGGFGVESAIALAVIQSLFSAATCLALVQLGRGLGQPRLGLLSGWAWALHPAAMFYAVGLPWDTTLSAFVATWFLAVFVRRAPETSAVGAAVLGVLFGALLLVQPALIALAPALAWYLFRERGGALPAGAFAVGAVLACAPWLARNAIRIGSPALRTNLGVELFVGNNDGAEGQYNGLVHPSFDPQEYALYVELGESGYASDAFGRFRAWAGEHPRRFAELCGIRVVRFWLGRDPRAPIPLGDGTVKQRSAAGWVKWLLHVAGGVLGILGAVLYRGRPADVTLVRGALVLFPLVYYATHVFERYRLPIEPLLTLLAVSLALRLWERWSE